MATNAFISFDHDDQAHVRGFKLLNTNPKYPLEFRDHSLKEPVTDRSGKPITYPPSDPRSKPVRDEILRKFDKCLKLIVLIGQDTHRSDWVEWEINSFFEMKKPLSEGNTWKRIRGMRLKDCDQAIMPDALAGKSTKVMNWDPEGLNDWIESNPDK